MKKSTIRKNLVCLVIILFIGFAVAPGITANDSLIKNRSQLTLEKETVDFTVEACGLNGGKQTVELTKEEAEEVEQLFNSIHERLNNTKTREETEEVFKEAVIELDKYGLLGDLSIREAQKLVIRNCGINKLEKLKNKNLGLDDNENMFCLIAGRTTNTATVGLGTILTSLRFITTGLIYELFISSLQSDLLDLFYIIRNEFWFFTTIFSYLLPLKLGGLMFFGRIYYGDPWQTLYYPSKGWVFTVGLNGVKTWDDSFYGNIREISFVSDFYLGATGFTGIKISPFGSGFYLGSALRVKLN